MKTMKELLEMEDKRQLHTILTRKKPFSVPFRKTESEWDVYKHDVMNPYKRKRKTIMVKSDKVDSRTGAPIFKEKKIERCRIAVPMQQVIVERSVGFLFSNPVEYQANKKLSSTQQGVYDAINDIFNDNKIKYFDKKLARTLFRERECAELWYFTLDEKGKPDKMRVKLLSPTLGDTLYPHFDKYDRLDGFSRVYQVFDEEMNKYTSYLDVYDNIYIHRYRLNAGIMTPDGAPTQHGFSKIPVIYYRQEETEWHRVQKAIDRVEELLSNWGDTNDYFGSPSYFFKGKMEGFAEKGEQGKVYQGSSSDTDMKVLSWDSSPESVRGELSTLINIIFSYTQTPDISFEVMKSLGGNTSGIAIKLMFTDPHMKAEVKIETFGEMFTRRFNLVMSGYATSVKAVAESEIAGIYVEPFFKPFLPKNEYEEIQLLSIATQKPTMSQEEGVKQNPRNLNPDEVMKQLKTEAKEGDMMELFGTAN